MNKQENLLKLIKDEELLFLLMRLHSWFKGAQMTWSDKKSDKIFKRDESFFINIKKIYPEEFKNQILYRFSAVDYNPKIKKGVLVNLKTANKPFQSWTSSKQSAIDFYKDIWANKSNRKDKRYIQVILKSNFSKNEILFSRNLVSKLCQDVIKLLPKIKIFDKQHYSQYKIMVNDCRRVVDSTFIKKQNEVVVNIPSEKRKCKIEEILDVFYRKW